MASSCRFVEGFHAAYPADRPCGAADCPMRSAKGAVVDEKCDIGDTFANDAEPALAHNPLDTPRWRRSCTRTPPATARPARRCSSSKEPPISRTTISHRHVRGEGLRRPVTPSTTASMTGADHGDPELNAAVQRHRRLVRRPRQRHGCDQHVHLAHVFVRQPVTRNMGKPMQRRCRIHRRPGHDRGPRVGRAPVEAHGHPWLHEVEQRAL